MKTAEQIFAALAAPFDERDVRFKPQTVSGNRAMAVAYIDARLVLDRLDAVLGGENWQDDYEQLQDGSMLCRLRVRVNGEWITKADAGGASKQPDAGDRIKSAFSAALKRAAAKYGIGRYLYRVPYQWVDYDPQKKQFARRPTLPDWARPASARHGPARPEPADPREPPPKAPQTATARPAASTTSGQLDRINEQLRTLNKSYDWLAANLKTRFATTEVRELTGIQADQVIAGLQAMIDQMPK